MNRLSSIFGSAIMWGIMGLLITGLAVFLGAPTFFGVVFITAGAVVTVIMWTVISTVLGTLVGWFRTRPAKEDRQAENLSDALKDPGLQTMMAGLFAKVKRPREVVTKAAKKASAKATEEKPLKRKYTRRATA